jgi:hypothetical protein
MSTQTQCCKVFHLLALAESTGVYTKNCYKVVKTKLLSIRFVQLQVDANHGIQLGFVR